MKTKLFAALLPVALWGCSFDTHNDVNVKVDRALDDFFDDVDNAKKAKPADAEKTKPTEPATK